MGREKEIEEMAKIITRRSAAFRNPNVAFMTTARKTADSIYSAGYRKQSEVVMEIFDDILKIKGLELHDWEAIFELKKKYTDGR